MRFAKYHGLGNDFVMIADPDDRLRLTPELVRRLCDRRFGVGGDGAIRIAPGRDGGELFMDYVNSDGSVGEMCGNGIRCLAVYARELGLTSADELKVSTRAGIKVVWVDGDDVRVDMGPPIFRPGDIPVRWEGTDALDARIPVGGREVPASCLSMGNPHAVIFVDDERVAPAELGPPIERHEMFPNGTNVEFVRVPSPERVWMRVWERGAGETLACGTGACAAMVAARLRRGTAPNVIVELAGGELQVEWSGSVESPAPVYMTGPVVKAFDAELDLEAYR